MPHTCPCCSLTLRIGLLVGVAGVDEAGGRVQFVLKLHVEPSGLTERVPRSWAHTHRHTQFEWNKLIPTLKHSFNLNCHCSRFGLSTHNRQQTSKTHLNGWVLLSSTAGLLLQHTLFLHPWTSDLFLFMFIHYRKQTESLCAGCWDVDVEKALS